MTEIVVASISGVLALIGVIISNRQTSNRMTNKLETTQVVTECKIDELTREVREHNNFARRMPVVEEQIKVINHRIEDIEKAR